MKKISATYTVNHHQKILHFIMYNTVLIKNKSVRMITCKQIKGLGDIGTKEKISMVQRPKNVDKMTKLI